MLPYRRVYLMNLPAQFGKYLLLHRLGQGGMAELFLAKQTGLKGFEKVLAIKKILPHLTQDPEFVSMFVNEGKLAALLTHQHIVQIFDLGHVEGAYYLAMEYVMGKDLRSVAARARERTGRVPIDHALGIVSQVASGLDYAHRKKDLNGRELSIVHRDVSPQNILVSYEGEVKLVDFGIAKAAGIGQETKTGILKGKLAYMSPEQAMGRPIDRRSDVFALGIVLYELLTGRRLFKGDSDLSTLEQVRTAQVEPPRRIDADIPEALEAVVMQALAKEPDRRFQTAADFQAALERVIAESGRGFSTLHLSQFMVSLFAEDQRADNERLLSIHHETVKVVPPGKEAAVAGSAEPRRVTSAPRAASRPQPTPQRHPVRTALLGAVLVFLLGSATVMATPSLLAWMRNQPDGVARVGQGIEARLERLGLSQLVPERGAAPRTATTAPGPAPAGAADAPAASLPELSLLEAADPAVPPPSESTPDPVTPVAAAAIPPAVVQAAPVKRTDVRRLLRQAKDLYAEGRLDAVEDILRTVIEHDPHSPVAYHLLGTLYLERKEEERAFKVFSEAAHQFPNDATLHYDLGFLYAQRGLGALAREELTRALALQPNGNLAARARVFLKAGTVARAMGPPAVPRPAPSAPDASAPGHQGVSAATPAPDEPAPAPIDGVVAPEAGVPTTTTTTGGEQTQ